MNSRKIGSDIWKYMIFFILIAFVVTCNFLLFLKFTDTLHPELLLLHEAAAALSS